MIKIGRPSAQAWATEFGRRHGDRRDGKTLQEAYLIDRTSADFAVSAMTQMGYTLFVVALVQYTNAGDVRHKVREIERILGRSLSVRTYTTYLNGVSHFVAGLYLARTARRRPKAKRAAKE